MRFRAFKEKEFWFFIGFCRSEKPEILPESALPMTTTKNSLPTAEFGPFLVPLAGFAPARPLTWARRMARQHPGSEEGYNSSEGSGGAGRKWWSAPPAPTDQTTASDRWPSLNLRY